MIPGILATIATKLAPSFLKSFIRKILPGRRKTAAELEAQVIGDANVSATESRRFFESQQARRRWKNFWKIVKLVMMLGLIAMAIVIIITPEANTPEFQELKRLTGLAIEEVAP